MNAKKEFMYGLLAAMMMLAAPLSHASPNVIVIAPAMYTEVCNHSGCIQHQVAPPYFAVPVHGEEETTVQYVPSTKMLFLNPDGLPAPRVAGKHVPARDCIYHGHALKPGGESQRYDRETGTHWRRMCQDLNGHGVMSPAVN